ncbi:MAG: hypothetical protein KJO29_04705, partial [Bacteroidia bacterium]|nr:hypothetical protein [Bacteroidia bacterium]
MVVQGDCCDEADFNKPSELTFRFLSGGCAEDDNSQVPIGKASCNGGVTGPGPYSYTAADGNNVFQTGTISLGDVFTIIDGGSQLPNPTTISIDGGQEIIEIHTSCSAPLIPGERYGSLELLSMVDGDGTECGDPCPDPILTGNTEQCLENTANFSLAFPEAGVSYVWDFGLDASPAGYTGQTPPPVTYSSIGWKEISVTQDGTCEKTLTIYVGECSCPVPIINYDPVCETLSTTFSTADLGDDYEYEWNFGAGATPATATGMGPHMVTYSVLGSATVTLDIERTCPPPIVPSGDCCEAGDPVEMSFIYVGTNIY